MIEFRMLTEDEIVDLQKDKKESYHKMVDILGKMNKKRIDVFPDYCSSGLWEHETGLMISECDVEQYVPEGLMIALYYWHAYWEGHTDLEEHKNCSDEFHADGRRIVKLMNESQTKFHFEYKQFD